MKTQIARKHSKEFKLPARTTENCYTTLSPCSALKIATVLRPSKQKKCYCTLLLLVSEEENIFTN